MADNNCSCDVTASGLYRVARVQSQYAENEPYLVMKNQILQSL